jgi:uncharacterized protein YjbJ (UPF0337 family)
MGRDAALVAEDDFRLDLVASLLSGRHWKQCLRQSAFFEVTHGKPPEIEMNQDRCAGMWKQFAGALKQKWGEQTHNQLLAIAGTRDQLAGRVRERYGVSKEDSARQLKVFRERNRRWYLSSQ